MTKTLKAGSLLLAAIIALSGCLFDSEDEGDRTLEIDGYVRDQIGEPIEGVWIDAYLGTSRAAVSPPDRSTRTNSRGYYRFSFDTSVREITMLPSKDDCVFRPKRISYYEPSKAIRNETITGYCGEMHRIDGHIGTVEGDPVSNVAVTIRDHLNRWDTTVYSVKSGDYSITNIVPGLTYIVTPSIAFYRFEPASRTYESLSQDFTEQDFIGHGQAEASN